MLILFLISVVIGQVIQPKCRVLVLSGGGSYGAYEAGSLSGLVFNLPYEEVMYDVITGISAGSINGLGLSQFQKGYEQEAARFLTRTWRTLDAHRSIMKPWPYLGILAGFIYESGFFDTSPERETLSKTLNMPIVRNFTAGVVNMATGEYEIFNENIGRDGIINAVMSSSAIPGVFPMQKMGDSWYADGGAKFHMDVASGVERCLKKFNEEDIIVDMISCKYRNYTSTVDKDFKTQDVIKRADEIKNIQKGLKFIETSILAYPKAYFRYFIYPMEDLPGEVGFRFDEFGIERSIKIGYRSSLEFITKNITAKDFLKWQQEDSLLYP